MSTSDDEEFESFIEDITPDVFASLQRENFFTSLEARIFPEGSTDRNECDGSFSAATALLTDLGHDEDAREDVFDVMRSKGGFCDCEIILNAAPESAARATYWKKKSHTSQ
jgi:Protein of unknown function (DUF2695)